jgi:hypothetical protein
MKPLNVIIAASIAIALMASAALAANEYAKTSAKLEEVLCNSFGLAGFRPSATMIDEQLHITLSSTLMGDYPTLADIQAIIELYYKLVAGTGYTGNLELVMNNLDGIAAYRWYIGPYTKGDFDSNQHFAIDNMQRLNPGLEGIEGSGAWLYKDPNYVGSKPPSD